MKHIGHPLFNDERYGGDKLLRGTHITKYRQFVYKSFNICPRQCLHALSLGFIHPTTGEEMNLESEVPNDMQQVINRWRTYYASRTI